MTGLFLHAMLKLLLVVLAAAVAALGAKSDPYQYDNEFVNSSYLLEHHYPARTFMAQRTIFQWADEAAIGGPWSTCFFRLSCLPSNAFYQAFSTNPLCHLVERSTITCHGNASMLILCPAS